MFDVPSLRSLSPFAYEQEMSYGEEMAKVIFKREHAKKTTLHVPNGSDMQARKGKESLAFAPTKGPTARPGNASGKCQWTFLTGKHRERREAADRQFPPRWDGLDQMSGRFEKRSEHHNQGLLCHRVPERIPSAVSFETFTLNVFAPTQLFLPQ